MEACGDLVIITLLFVDVPDQDTCATHLLQMETISLSASIFSDDWISGKVTEKGLSMETDARVPIF